MPSSTRGNRRGANGKGSSRACCRGCPLPENCKEAPPAARYDSQRSHMNSRRSAVLCLVLGLTLAPVACAAPPVIAQTEINYLLGFIESSACEFFRNGSWYDAKKAAAHLRDKYEFMATGNRIQTVEDFIEEAA